MEGRPDTPALLAELDSDDWSALRKSVDHVVEALRVGDVQAGDLVPLGARLAALATHPRWQVRKAVVHALYLLRDESSRAVLAELQADRNAFVRDAATQALEARHRRRRAETLRERHEDPLIDWLSGDEGLQGSRARDAALRVGRRYTELLVRQAQQELQKIVEPIERAAAALRRDLGRARLDRGACEQQAERIHERLRALLGVLESLPEMTTGAVPALRGDELRPLFEGRADEEPLPQSPRPRAAPARGLMVRLPARRVGKRYTIGIGSSETELSLGRFMLLLKVIAARLRPGGPWIHRNDLGARIEHGWKGVILLNNDVADLLPAGLVLVENDGAGCYRLNQAIDVGEADLDAIAQITPEAAKIARELRALLPEAGPPDGTTRQ